MSKLLHLNDSGTLVESCQSIDVNAFISDVSQRLKEELIKASLSVEGQHIKLTSSQLAHGGLRYWFQCPGCLSRSGKLYRHPVTSRVACRKCNGLEYKSRRYKGMVESG